jgi:abequosyltransferase
MKRNKCFLSICIPSYNRPQQLYNLIMSIDCDPLEVEIIISEDNSPKQLHVRKIVDRLKKSSSYKIHYHENIVNLGFDGNIRNLVTLAKGQYLIFMGDDDLFISRSLNKYIYFLKNNTEKKYVLRSYNTMHEDGKIERFRYMEKETSLPPGEETVGWLFKRSVSIAGFTIDREQALKHSTNKLDGTLLYQVYLMSQVCLQYDSIYCDIPVVYAVQSFRDNKPMFGNSEAEKSRYTPGSVTQQNSINFTASYFEVAKYLDRLHDTHIGDFLKIDLSKYSYPFLSIQRKNGIFPFLKYSKRLEKELGFGCTIYFYVYKWSLVFLGEKICDKIIILIKNILGFTPNLR